MEYIQSPDSPFPQKTKTFGGVISRLLDGEPVGG